MREIERLSALRVKNEKRPGRHADGGGLYLQIKNGGRSWVFIYRDSNTKKLRNLGFGSLNAVPLAEARKRAGTTRLLLSAGNDPLADRRAKRAALQKTKTFGVYTEEFLASAISGFKNKKHRAQWGSTLRTYCKTLWPIMLPDIQTHHVKAVLDPIWTEIPETARRLRGRIERVLSAAKADGLRDGLNPARWPDNLKPHFENRAKKSDGHHAAMAFEQLPDFIPKLRALDSTSARALEFTILTVARTSEVRFAKWGEVDFNEKVWTIPPERMKAGVEHEVPLSDRAVAILKAMRPGKKDALIFPGTASGEPLSDQAMLQCLRGLVEGVTTHGMRSAFRDWAGDATSYPRDLVELALAHTIKNKTERAYRRRKGLERRRAVMADWATYLATPRERGDVVPMRQKRQAV